MANYRKFWESLVPRIGVATADGWNSFNEEENTQREWIDGEIDDLNGAKLEKQSVEDEEFASYRRNTLTLLEARRRLEKFRSRYYWEPVKYKHDDVKLYEYSSRIVRFDDVKPILFPLEQSLACDLIYKLLHIFGVTIPGLDLCSQEDILRAFSSKLFPSFRPNSLQLDKFSAFIGNFIQQLANSDNIDDPARLYTAIVMNISNSGIKDSEKIAKLKDLVRHTNKMKRHGTDQTINLECQFSILTFAFEELMKLAPKDRYPIEIAFKLLYINLDVKNTSIWEFTTNANEDDSRRSMNRRQRLGYLRFILMIARTLPFSDDEEADMQANAFKIKGNTEREFCLRTKREFLLNIWATGKLEQIPITNQYIEIARKKVQQMLKNGAPRNVDDLKHRWFGNEYEIIFELAAYFLYEYSFAGYHKYTLFQNLRPLFTSELAKSLTNSQVLVEIRVQMLQHITRVCKGLHFTPANLINLIGEQIKQFPHSIPLLKALLDVNNRFKQKFFLWNYPGQDNLTKLIRNCGRLYAERIPLDTDIKVRGNNEKEVKTMITRMVSLYRKTAEESSDNLIPDDYFWVILIRMMIESNFHLSFGPIQEVFILGQEVCPWSKTFLFEAARERPAADNFHVILNSSTNTHGLSKYCTDEETKLILANEIA